MSEVPPILQIQKLEVRTHARLLLRNITLSIFEGEIFGLIGPSGAGKSTLLRSLNRLNDLLPGLYVKGDVLLRGQSVYARDTEVNSIRTRIGMLFQQPVIFPTTIRENVLFGAKRVLALGKVEQTVRVESALRESSLWDEVKDRLQQPASALSVGQQQRLCLARALAVQPEVLLMDEPTSALDPRSTAAIEELLLRLKTRHTIVIVTHNITQARRVTSSLAFVAIQDGAGEILEHGATKALLSAPKNPILADYLTHSS